MRKGVKKAHKIKTNITHWFCAFFFKNASKRTMNYEYIHHPNNFVFYEYKTLKLKNL